MKWFLSLGPHRDHATRQYFCRFDSTHTILVSDSLRITLVDLLPVHCWFHCFVSHFFFLFFVSVSANAHFSIRSFLAVNFFLLFFDWGIAIETWIDIGRYAADRRLTLSWHTAGARSKWLCLCLLFYIFGANTVFGLHRRCVHFAPPGMTHSLLSSSRLLNVNHIFQFAKPSTVRHSDKLPLRNTLWLWNTCHMPAQLITIWLLLLLRIYALIGT